MIFPDYSCKLILFHPIVMSQYTEQRCVLCQGEFNSDNEPVSVTARGLNTLLQFSSGKGDTELFDYLSQSSVIVNVHEDCRRNYTRKRSVASSEPRPPPKKPLRSSHETVFDWKTNCLFCGVLVDLKRERLGVQYSSVMTIEFKDNVLKTCEMRNDTCAIDVKARLNMCCDLVAAEAIYHRSCRTLFSSNKPLPIHKSESASSSVGRPEDMNMSLIFSQLCDLLELADTELFTLRDLHDKMIELSGNDYVYSETHLKRKLEEQYGDHIFFAEISGRRNVICFREMSRYVIIIPINFLHTPLFNAKLSLYCTKSRSNPLSVLTHVTQSLQLFLPHCWE